MPLLSDREAFDRAAMEAVEDKVLVEVMNNVVHRNGGTLLRENDYDALELAASAAKRQKVHWAYAAIQNRIEGLENDVDWTKMPEHPLGSKGSFQVGKKRIR